MKRKTKATRKPVSSRGGAAVWALAAVSSEGQSETLVHQRRWAEESAASHGWHLTRVIEGVATGKGGPRRIVRDLLADLRALDAEARPKKLLMIRADRLGRGSIVESQIVLRDLLELGVGVFTRDQGDVKLDSAMDELISAATLAVARHENEVRREKSLAVYRRKRAAGERIGSKAPYGIHRKNGKDVPDRERAPIVRQAFKLRLEGKGYDVIGRRLSGIAPPHVYLNGNSRAVHWTPRRYLPARSGSPECLLMIASVMRGVGILGRWLDRCDAIAGGYSSAWLAAWNRGVIDTMRAAPDGITTGA